MTIVVIWRYINKTELNWTELNWIKYFNFSGLVFSPCGKSQRGSKCGPCVQQMECFHNLCISGSQTVTETLKWKSKQRRNRNLIVDRYYISYANLCNTIFYHCFHFLTSSLNSSSCLNVLISSTNHIHPFTHIYKHTAPSEETSSVYYPNTFPQLAWRTLELNHQPLIRLPPFLLWLQRSCKPH